MKTPSNSGFSKRKLIQIILKHAHMIGPSWYLILLCMIGISFLELGFPYITKFLYQHIEQKSPIQDLIMACIYGGLYFTLVIGLSFIKDTRKQTLWIRYENMLFIKYREDLRYHSYQDFIQYSSGTLLSKFEQGIQAELDLLDKGANILVSTIIRGGSIIVLYARTDYRLILLLLPLIIIYAFIEYKTSTILEEVSDQIRGLNEQKTSTLSSFFSDFFTIKLWNKFDHEQQRFAGLVDKLPSLSKKESRLSSFKYDSLRYLFNLLDIVLITFLGYKLITSGSYTISDIVFLTTYIWWFWSPLSHLITAFSSFQKNATKIQSLYDFLYSNQQLVDGSSIYEYKRGMIEFKDITFGYQGKKDLLEQFNLTIKGGKTVALVGNSGSGKTTLVKLLLRLFDPQQGSIMIDNQLLTELNLQTYYQEVGYLTQDPAIFDGTVYENLIYGYRGRSDASESEIQTALFSALKLAKCDFVDHMPQGLNTPLGDRGVKLSGGEKQRLAIARIFLKNPHI
ncbi:MAG TPA: ABC transporter ATP-binding protein, partial [Candidatus Absconditabacterales bacterium]|nr:ABC transporter ATP-binding protein [Candidatus Absconditabacterales bacterium]